MKWNGRGIAYVLSVIFLVHISDIRAESSSWLPAFIQTRLYQKKQVPVTPQIAVIDFDNNVDLKKLEIALFDIAKKQSIHGILFNINHNGGRGDIGVIHDLIQRIKHIKPVVCLIRGAAYSAGYNVASACDYIIAHTTSGIGSIGVYSEIERWDNQNLSRDKDGYKSPVRVYVFNAGKYKGLNLPCRDDLSEDDRKYIQEEIEKDYQQFIVRIAQNRNLDIACSDDWAEGKIFTASEALERGLIDEIGTVFEAEDKLLQLVGQKYSDLAKDGSIRYVTMN